MRRKVKRCNEKGCVTRFSLFSAPFLSPTPNMGRKHLKTPCCTYNWPQISSSYLSKMSVQGAEVQVYLYCVFRLGGSRVRMYRCVRLQLFLTFKLLDLLPLSAHYGLRLWIPLASLHPSSVCPVRFVVGQVWRTSAHKHTQARRMEI